MAWVTSARSNTSVLGKPQCVRTHRGLFAKGMHGPQRRCDQPGPGLQSFGPASWFGIALCSQSGHFCCRAVTLRQSALLLDRPIALDNAIADRDHAPRGFDGLAAMGDPNPRDAHASDRLVHQSFVGRVEC